jgi:hypothetical protein
MVEAVPSMSGGECAVSRGGVEGESQVSVLCSILTLARSLYRPHSIFGGPREAPVAS